MTEDTPFRPFAPMFEEPAPPAADKPATPAKGGKPRTLRVLKGSRSVELGYVEPGPSRTSKPARQPRPPSPAKGGQKAELLPAPKHARPTRKKTKSRKKRTAPVQLDDPKLKKAAGRAYRASLPRPIKMDFSSALEISALLKASDHRMFESVMETLQATNKAGRRRVLSAIQKVFG